MADAKAQRAEVCRGVGSGAGRTKSPNEKAPEPTPPPSLVPWGSMPPGATASAMQPTTPQPPQADKPTAHARCAYHAPCPLYLFFFNTTQRRFKPWRYLFYRNPQDHGHPIAEPLQASNPRWQCAPSLCLQPSSLPSPCASIKTPHGIAHPPSPYHLRQSISPKSMILSIIVYHYRQR